jgi:hypothetical protein
MPRNAEEFIAHAVYDPKARRERYLRSRHLKGRQRAFPLGPPKAGPGSRIVDTNARGSTRHVSKAAMDAAAAQAASTARQVAAIEGRLSHLKELRTQLIAKIKAEHARAASTSPAKKTTPTKKSTKPAPPKTAKQKQAAKQSLAKARAAKKAAAPATPAKPTLTLQQQLDHVNNVIDQVETTLKQVKARTQTA